MQTITITGSLGKDATIASTQRGDSVCSFNVACNQGYGDRKTTNWFRVSLWGKRGESIQPYLLKGVKVAVSGEFELSEYEGKPQLNIRANEVDIMSSRKEQNASRDDGLSHRNREGFGGSNAPTFDNDLDDSVPFIVSDFAFEHPVRRVI